MASSTTGVTRPLLVLAVVILCFSGVALAAADDTRSLRRQLAAAAQEDAAAAGPMKKENACNVTVTLKVAPAELQPNMSALVDGRFVFTPVFRPEADRWMAPELTFKSAVQTWEPGRTYTVDGAIWNCSQGNLKSIYALFKGEDLLDIYHQIALTYLKAAKVAPTVEKAVHYDPREHGGNSTIVIGALGCGLTCGLPLAE